MPTKLEVQAAREEVLVGLLAGYEQSGGTGSWMWENPTLAHRIAIDQLADEGLVRKGNNGVSAKLTVAGWEYATDHLATEVTVSWGEGPECRAKATKDGTVVMSVGVAVHQPPGLDARAVEEGAKLLVRHLLR